MPRPEVMSAQYQNVARIEWLNQRLEGGNHDLVVSQSSSKAVIEALTADENMTTILENMKWLHFLQRAVVTVRHLENSGQTHPLEKAGAPFDEILYGAYSPIGDTEIVTGYVEGSPTIMPVTAVVEAGQLTDFTADWFGGLVDRGNYRPIFYNQLLPLLEGR